MRKVFGFFRKTRGLFRFRPPESDLSYLFSQPAKGESLEASISWLHQLVRWIRLPSAISGIRTRKAELKTVRLRFILQHLARNEEWRSNFSQYIKIILTQTSGIHLFAESGLMQEDSLVGETINRFLKATLPVAPNAEDLADALAKIFLVESDVDWVRTISTDEDQLRQIFQSLSFSSEERTEISAHLKSDLSDALIILSSQVTALGTSASIRERLPSAPLSRSAFLRLSQALQNRGLDLKTKPADCVNEIEMCREAVKSVFRRLDNTGVSVDLVYRLEDLTQSLDRIELILKVLGEGDNSPKLCFEFLAVLIRDELASRSIRELFRSTTHVIARKIVERTGQSGEHYITQSRAEYFRMLFSAGGGGLLTVGTAVMKYFIVNIKLPLFIEGLFSAVNYSGSFVVMQLCGFTLATKQPSMTAATLASKLEDLRTRSNVDSFVDEFVKIARSQFAAMIGNVGLVIPGALIADILVRLSTGRGIFDMEYAHHSLESLDPLRSLTIPFAALTGVLLWASSLIAGWIENWVVFRGIPDAIAGHTHLRGALGEKSAQKISKWFVHNISGLSGSVSLGVLLAFTPIIGRFFGIPIDVRHVTLSTGALTLAISEIGVQQIPLGLWISSITGIVLVGALNFGVSFALALWVACRARNVRRIWVLTFLGASLKRFRTHPFEFFFPKASRE